MSYIGKKNGNPNTDFLEAGGELENHDLVNVDDSGNVNFGDNEKAQFGAGNDLEIYHDGTNSIISDQGAGNLLVQGNELTLEHPDGTNFIKGRPTNKDVVIYYNGSQKLATTSTGIDVTGTVTADGLTIDGVVELNSPMVDLSTAGWSDLPLRIDASSSVNNTGYIGIGFATSTSSGFGYSTGAVRDGTNGYGSYQIRYHGASDIGTPRLTIDSSGKVTMWNKVEIGDFDNAGVTSGARFNVDSTDVELMFSTTTTGTGVHQRFYNPNGNVGTIYTTGSSTVYSTSSDYRLKENVVDMTGAIDRVKALQPKRFNFIADADTTVDGFLAHEVSDVIPEAISGEKDATREEEYEVTPAVLDDNGNVVTEAVMGTRTVPDYQGIDQSKLVPLLTGALQEAIAKIEALETRIEALENA